MVNRKGEQRYSLLSALLIKAYRSAQAHYPEAVSLPKSVQLINGYNTGC